MLKLLAIILLVFLFFRSLGFIIRYVLRGTIGSRGQQDFSRPESRRPSDGNVNVDYVPEDRKRKGKSKKDFDGGEYVDYEEIK